MVRGPLQKMVILYLAFVFLVSSVPPMVTLDVRSQGPDPVEIVMENTEDTVNVTDLAGADAEFHGHIQVNYPLIEVTADLFALMMDGSDWEAWAEPESIQMRGRGRRDFKFVITVPEGTANGTNGTGVGEINIVFSGPGASGTMSSKAGLSVDVMRTDGAGPSSLTDEGSSGGTDRGTNNRTGSPDRPTDIDWAGINPYIAAGAVIGIVVGLVIKVKGRRERLRREAEK